MANETVTVNQSTNSVTVNQSTNTASIVATNSGAGLGSGGDIDGNLTITPTWNIGGNEFTSLLVNATDTASAATSELLDLQTSGSSKFIVLKTGNATLTGQLAAASLDISGDVDVDGTLETDALTINGTASNAFTSALLSKLNAIEASATADQTAAEIRTLVESASDSNVFTDADHTKLNAIEASADVTDTTNVVAALTAGTNIAIAGDGTISSTDTNTQLTSEQVQDIVGAMVASNTESGITVTYEDSDGTIDFAVASQTDENFTTADHSKLDGIEAGADVTPTWVPDADPSYATLTYVSTQISNLIDSSPAALNTLNELAAALGDDANFSTTVTNSIAAKLPLGGGTMTGNIVMSGSETVDGRDLSVDGAKLDGIEASATADQTASEIRTLVESASDSNVFTDADHSKLNAIEASADVTDTTNVVAALTAGTNIAIAGDGTISSTDTNTQLSTEQVQDIVGAMVASNTETGITVTYEDSDGTIDFVVASQTDENFTTADHSKLDGIEASATADQTASEIRTLVESASDSNVFTDADHSKLNAIEASADVTDTTNVVAALTAGTNITIAGDGTISSADADTQLTAEQVQDIVGAMVSSNTESAITVTYEDSDGTLDFAHNDTSSVSSADLSNGHVIQDLTVDTYGHVTGIGSVNLDDRFLELSGGTLTGNIVMSGSETVDGRDLSVDGAKLDGIEASATADQTASEIRTLVESASDSNVFTDADHTKLNAIEASADVTDTANVVAALTAGTNITIAGDGTISSADADTQLTAEQVQDIVGAMVASNTESGITVTYEDSDGTIDFAVASQTDENFTTADHAKLDGIEASATADQTASEIRTLVESASDSNVFTDADHSKLNAIEASADVTDTTNVVAALTAGSNIAIAGDGTISSTDTNTQLSTEQVQDIIGAMVSSNTESGITVTYEDSDGTIDFAVTSQTDENFTTADHAKLDGIEASATADQTASEIRTLVESASDSNVFTDADHSKLNAIEASADVTDTTNVVAALTAGSNIAIAGDGTITATDTNTQLSDEQVQDIVGAMVSSNTESGITVTYQDGDGTIDFSVASQTDENFTTADHSKLDGIEASADVTDTANVVAALTAGSNIAIAGDGTITATDTNTQLSTEQVQDIVGAMVASNTESGITVTYEDSDGTIDFSVASQTDENFTTADHAKLDGIEASATADQTASEIRTLVESASDSNVFTDADHSKLNAIEASADVTDTTNVVAALTAGSNISIAGDGTIAATNTQLSNEQVQDIVGAMVSSNTESGITVTYEDGDGTLDFAVASQTDQNFTNADHSKLDGIEASADVTPSWVPDADPSYATQSYVGTQISNLIDSSPAALNTLNELAAALGDDANFSTTVTNSIATKLPLAGGTMTGNIVMSGSETVDGRDLSADGTKLDNIEASADVTDTANVVAALTAGTNIAIAGDGTISSTDTNTQLSTEQVQDIVGAMVSSNTESGITVTYQDGDGTIDFSVASQTDENFTTADHSKLDGIEASATADQTASEIRTLVESASDSNVFTDADHSKLNAIEASADVTDTTNVVAALTAGSNIAIAGDGTISSTDTNTQLSDEQVQDIVGAMVASNTESGITVTYQDGDGTIDFSVASQTDQNFTNADHTKLDGIEASADVTDTTNVVAALTAGSNIAIAGDGTISSTDTNTQLSTEQVQDIIGAMVASNTESGITVTYEDSDGTLDFSVTSQTDENFTTADHAKLDGIEASATADQTASEIRTLVESASDSNVFTDADHSKLNAIEASADVTDTTNVVAALTAGSNIAIAGDGTISSTDTNTQLSDEQVQDIVGAMVSSNTESGITVTYQDGDGTIDFSVASQTDQNFTNADHSKLDGIEASATADQTASEIRTLVESASDSNVFTDADHTKLNAIEASADVTDTTNVVAALTAGSNIAIAGDGTITATDTNTQLSDEQVQDIVGAMVSSNTESGITVTYQDGDGTIDFSVASQTDENFTTADHSKLDGIEASADVTDATNVAAAGALMLNTGGNIVGNVDIDGEFSIDGTHKATFGQGHYITGRSSNLDIVAFDNSAKLNLVMVGNAGGKAINFVTSTSSPSSGATTVGSIDDSGNLTLDGTVDGRDVASDGTKLDGIEASADVTDTANVVAALTAGSNISIAGDGTITATDTNTQLSTEQVQDIVGAMVSSNTESGITVTYQDGDGTIDFSVASQTDENFTTADHSKLDGIEASADVTDTTNVVAALTAGSNISIAGDGTITATDTNTQLSTEQVQDIVGAMVSSNTETGITVAYEDGDGTIDFSVTPSSIGLGNVTNESKATMFTDAALTGNPTAPTQSAGNNSTRIATTAYADAAAAALVDSAPSALNTLNELAAALGDDASFSTTVTNSIATKLPLAGGTMTGNLILNQGLFAQFGSKMRINQVTSGNSTISALTDDLVIQNSDSSGRDIFLRAYDGSSGVTNYLTINGGTQTIDLAQNLTTTGTIDGRDVATDGTKLDGIEASADVTDTANVVAALTAGSNIAIAGDGTITATDTNTQLSNEQVQDIVGAMVSSNTESGITVTYQDGDGTIDFSVASQTDNNFTNADHTKLDGIEASADVTDTTNVVAALTAGSNIAIAGDGTISATDTNTQLSTEQVQDIVGAMVSSNTETGITVTYQDGDGTIDFVHNDTSSVSSANLSNGFVIQDLTIDTYGHVTGIGSVDLDGRYYTESEVVNHFKTLGVQGNFMSTYGWSLTTSGGAANGWDSIGTAPFSFNDIYSANGTTAENTRAVESLPNGAKGVVWQTPSNDAASGADGGWNCTINGVDSTKGYRSVVYFRPTDDSTSGTFYHGCNGSHTLNIDGTTNTNPYFKSQSYSSFVQDRWYVSIGYIQPYQSSGATTSGQSGIYDCTTGKKVFSGTDFMMKDGSTTQQHRTYLYYSTDTATSIDFYGPRFEEVNGNEPSTQELVNKGLDGLDAMSFHSKYDPEALSQLTESTDATTDKIFLWDESGSEWKYMTLDDLQDSINTDTNTQLSDEQVQDIVGAMVSSNTESGITVTYQDGDGTLDFSVASQTDENFTTADHAKLDGIEASATADQTASEIRTLVESASDSNVFTDADHSKLNAIEASADVTDTTNVVAALTAGSNIAIAGDGTITATDTNTQLSTEQVEDIVGAMVSSNTESGITVTYQDGDGTLDFSVASQTDENFTTADHAKLDGIEASATADQTASEIRTLVESASDSNVFTDADHSKLNAIEASADVTDTTNVVAALTAGSNIAIAGDGTISSTDTNTQLSDEQVQDIVGAMVSSNTESGITVTYQDGDGTIDFSVASQTDQNFTNADHTKLDGIEASADVTDTTNVVAALTAGSNIAIAGDGTISSTDTNTQLSDEQVQDIVGAMVSSNSESGITVTYQDSDGTIDFSVASQTDNNFTNADHTKLDGIEASADVTDITNIQSALGSASTVGIGTAAPATTLEVAGPLKAGAYVVDKSADFTLSQGDNGTFLNGTSASFDQISITSDIMVGFAATVVNPNADVDIVASNSMSINGTTNGTVTLAQGYQPATIIRVSSNTYMVFGNLL